MNTLLLEIGAEEIPAGYIEPALTALSAMILKKLTDARISHGTAKTYGTPRRLAVEISDVADQQEPLTTELVGPPEKVGFDENGNPTVAAQKFAEKVGISVDQIRITETKKGKYLCADKTEEGVDTHTLLQKILPDVITSIPFPKTMKWADLNLYFARPIHTILALLGDKVIPFGLGNIKSGNYTLGHRFMHPDNVMISTPGEYLEALRSSSVITDLEERKHLVEEEVSRIANELGGRVLPDPELVDIVKNLVEYPIAVAGRFDEAYLEVPDEVLITAMREHQKYFAVIDENEKLMPCFIAVNNTRAKDMALVGTGHERVLRARLADAQFFYKSDLKESFESRIEKLKGVLFQAKLGSMYKKVIQVQELAAYLGDEINHGSDLKEKASRAALLCKADLVSEVVGEFPKLQGIMGRIYAGVTGEAPEVASAIEEHYRPTHSGGQLPETMTGAVLAIADKMNSICGCFSVGLVPTGASDPYALRRQAIGIIQIMLKKEFSFSLKALIEKSLRPFTEQSEQNIEETANAVHTFLQNRMAHLMAEEGYSKDVIAAVTDISVDHVPNVWNRVRALENLKAKPDFEQLSIAFKRVVNIIRQAGERGDTIAEKVDETLFEHESESALFLAYKDVKKKVDDDLVDSLFDQALLDIASLRDTVDAFFDGVLVMAEDVSIRSNRLALLKHLADLFGLFADFSKIST